MPDPKRKPGRPATVGATTNLSIRLPSELLEKLKAKAGEQGYGQFLRKLIEASLR